MRQEIFLTHLEAHDLKITRSATIEEHQFSENRESVNIRLEPGEIVAFGTLAIYLREDGKISLSSTDSFGLEG